MANKPDKPEFWETAFNEKHEMWGFEPSKSALLTQDFFIQKSVKNILIPGIGYGRNAQIFIDNGIAVTGIEISKSAIEMARKHYGTDMTIHHGSVTDMPFGDNNYIRCYEKTGFTFNPDKTAVFNVGDKKWTAINMSIGKKDWVRLLS